MDIHHQIITNIPPTMVGRPPELSGLRPSLCKVSIFEILSKNSEAFKSLLPPYGASGELLGTEISSCWASKLKRIEDS
jgi:hypothetical protein